MPDEKKSFSVTKAETTSLIVRVPIHIIGCSDSTAFLRRFSLKWYQENRIKLVEADISAGTRVLPLFLWHDPGGRFSDSLSEMQKDIEAKFGHLPGQRYILYFPAETSKKSFIDGLHSIVNVNLESDLKVLQHIKSYINEHLRQDFAQST